MKKLIELYRDRIMGAISGLDRIRFAGHCGGWPVSGD